MLDIFVVHLDFLCFVRIGQITTGLRCQLLLLSHLCLSEICQSIKRSSWQKKVA